MYGFEWWYCIMSLIIFGKLLLPAFIIIFVISMAIMHFVPKDIILYELMPLILFFGISLAIFLLPFVCLAVIIWFLIMVIADY